MPVHTFVRIVVTGFIIDSWDGHPIEIYADNVLKLSLNPTAGALLDSPPGKNIN